MKKSEWTETIVRWMARWAAVMVVFAFFAAPALSKEIPKAKTPEEVGFSSERLKRLSLGIQKDVAQGAIPGAVAMIVRKGKVAYSEAFGYQDREQKIPMSRDSIFRIASMTKPFTSLAVMMLAEEGKIQLVNPVSRYIPEFKELKVGVEKKDDSSDKLELTLVPAVREVTVQDLMRHTSGLTYGIFGKSMVKDRYNAVNAMDPNQTNAELASKLAQLPLQFQPGTTWEYSMSTDLLARIVEVVSGMDFDVFVEQRICKPLDLTNTGFWVEGKERQARIAEPQIDQATGKRPLVRDVTQKPRWMSGGGGMVSSARDYARLCQMFLNGGSLDGTRLVSGKTVELMRANHLPPGVAFAPLVPMQFGAFAPTPDMGQGFGLGFAVRVDQGRNPLPGSIGDYSWAGLYGTYFWIDPKESLFAVFMMQNIPLRLHYRYLMRHYVYQAFCD